MWEICLLYAEEVVGVLGGDYMFVWYSPRRASARHVNGDVIRRTRRARLHIKHDLSSHVPMRNVSQIRSRLHPIRDVTNVALLILKRIDILSKVSNGSLPNDLRLDCWLWKAHHHLVQGDHGE